MEENDLTEKATILLVDDMPDDLALMSSLLKGIYKVIVADNGEKGLKVAASDSPPDLILLDIMMHGMDGYEVCWRLKHDQKTLNIPVIFLTGKTDSVDEKKGLDLGAADFISKPINAEIFMARIKNHLALKFKADRVQVQKDMLEIEVAELKHPIQSLTPGQ